MNRNLAAFITATILGTTLVATASGIQQDGWARHRASDVLIRRVEHRLKITDEQRASIKQILQTEQPTIQSLAQKVRQQNNEVETSTHCPVQTILHIMREDEIETVRGEQTLKPFAQFSIIVHDKDARGLKGF